MQVSVRALSIFHLPNSYAFCVCLDSYSTSCPVCFVCFPSNGCGDWCLSCNFFSHSSPIITFNYGDEFITFFRAVCWRVWHWQIMLSYSFAEKGSVMTILTVWLSMWVVCQLFVCHLIGWVTDLWTAESLASFQTWWLTDSVSWQDDWLDAIWLRVCVSVCVVETC